MSSTGVGFTSGFDYARGTMGHQAQQVQHLEVRGKTEQRVAAVIQTLQQSREKLTYEELTEATGAAYDVLLYITLTLVEIGLVVRSEEGTPGPGRPKVYFEWDAKAARGMGLRSAA